MRFCARFGAGGFSGRGPPFGAQVRTDHTYPTGFMDVVEIEKTDEHFRLVYDTKGRFVVHRISKVCASFHSCTQGACGTRVLGHVSGRAVLRP